MKPLTLENLSTELDAHVAESPSTIVGWAVIFAVSVDLVANSLGGGAFSMLILGGLSKLFDIGTSLLWVMLVVQVGLLAYGSWRIYESAWRLHLGYALRESTLWSLLDGEAKTEGRHLPRRERWIMRVCEIVILVVFIFLFLPLFTDAPLLKVLAILIILVFGSTVFSVLLRKLWSDRAVMIAVIITCFLGVICFEYAPSLTELSSSAGMFRGSVSEFQSWQIGVFTVVVILYSTFALSDFKDRDSPQVSIDNNTVTFHKLDEGLRGLKLPAFRASLVPGVEQKVIVFSEPWGGKSDIVTVHRNRIHLPLVARHFWFWDLSILQELLSAPVDFRQPTANGMYILSADISSVPDVTYLKKPPEKLHSFAVGKAETKLLDKNVLTRELGEALLREVDGLIARSLQDVVSGNFEHLDDRRSLDVDDSVAGGVFANVNTVDSGITLGEVAAAIEAAKSELLVALETIKPTFRGEIEKLTQVEQKAHLHDTSEILRVTLQRVAQILDVFAVDSINAQIKEYRNLVPKIVRSIASFPSSRAITPWSKSTPDDDDFYDSSVDFVIDVLGLSVDGLVVELSEGMVELRKDADDFRKTISEELRSWMSEASSKEIGAFAFVAENPRYRSVMNSLNIDMPTPGGRRPKRSDNNNQAEVRPGLNQQPDSDDIHPSAQATDEAQAKTADEKSEASETGNNGPRNHGF